MKSNTQNLSLCLNFCSSFKDYAKILNITIEMHKLDWVKVLVFHWYVGTHRHIERVVRHVAQVRRPPTDSQLTHKYLKFLGKSSSHCFQHTKLCVPTGHTLYQPCYHILHAVN
jgi:hypothetical protein